MYFLTPDLYWLGGSKLGWCRWGWRNSPFFFSLHFFVFLRFSLFFIVFKFFFVFLLFTQKPMGRDDCNLLQKWEFHSDPVCTDPVQNFPNWTHLAEIRQSANKRNHAAAFGGPVAILLISRAPSSNSLPRAVFHFLQAVLRSLCRILRGKTIRGNTTRNSERKMAL